MTDFSDYLGTEAATCLLAEGGIGVYCLSARMSAGHLGISENTPQSSAVS